MDVQERLKLIREVGEEIISEDELSEILKTKTKFIAYDGFEPSGTDIHIAQGLLRAININKMTKAGAHFKMWVADWHAWANNKMGGDIDKIQLVGKYMIEVWKACGMDLSNVEFVWVSDAVSDPNYWKIVMQVARNSTVNRIIRCGQIMGRKENEVMQASQILYPCMQCADIFYLKADICQLGMDQRKVNVLARELGPSLGFWKPVIVSHHMLMGLTQSAAGADEKDALERTIALKMSKSIPDSAIFMTDSAEDIKRKMKKAWCPEGVAKENPVLEYFKYIIFELNDEVKIIRPEKWGGNLTFNSYHELEDSFVKNEIHPMDLKESATTYLEQLLKPIREKILGNKEVVKMRDTIKSFLVTR
jgi:tyrosyl-tRNA synthetase